MVLPWIRAERGALLAALVAAVMLVLPTAAALAQQGGTPSLSLEAVMQQTQRTAGGSVRPPDNAVTNAPAAPGESRPLDYVEPGAPGSVAPLSVAGPNSDATIWGLVRQGGTFTTQAPGPTTNFLVQDAGMPWLQQRMPGGTLYTWGAYALGGVLVLLALFYLLRGRIRIEHGKAGTTIERFKGIERFGHWTLAVSFILLALTGLNLLYGRDLLIPLIGHEAFAQISLAGKWVHNNVSWAFMLALVLVFVMWVFHNIPSRIDLIWLAKGGGLFSKGVHPPSRKFNAGQKIIFWSTILLGASVSVSGISLLFPYELPLFAKTFEVLNQLGAEAMLGFALPTQLSPIQEMQYAQLWHTIVAVAMMVVILAHIYIGSMGMEGAFDAMGSGQVDRNWAKEHHGLWVEEVDARNARTASRSPAE